MTKGKMLIIAALIALPGVAAAMGCSGDHQAMSCAEGTVWDQASNSCVKQVSS